LPKKLAAAAKHRGVGEVEVVVEERRGGQTKTVSLYKDSGHI
jgi:replicative DNA helicase